MGWTEVSTVSARREFVSLARQPGANVRALCGRYGVSPTTAYKWIHRGGDAAETFEDRSRRPHGSPNRTEPEIEALVLSLRDDHPVWNAHRRSLRRGDARPQSHSSRRHLGRLFLPGAGCHHRSSQPGSADESLVLDTERGAASLRSMARGLGPRVPAPREAARGCSDHRASSAGSTDPWQSRSDL